MAQPKLLVAAQKVDISVYYCGREKLHRRAIVRVLLVCLHEMCIIHGVESELSIIQHADGGCWSELWRWQDRVGSVAATAQISAVASLA